MPSVSRPRKSAGRRRARCGRMWRGGGRKPGTKRKPHTQTGRRRRTFRIPLT